MYRDSIEIVREILRDELIDMVLNMNEINVVRFIQLYRLNMDEINLFEYRFSKCNHVLMALEYYQRNNKDVYKNYYNCLVKRKEK